MIRKRNMKELKAKKELAMLKNDDCFQTKYFTGNKEAVARMEYLTAQAYPVQEKVSY